jgi:hypothetical protein
MVFIALVLVPVTRGLADPALRRPASWVARVNLLVVLAVVFLGLALRG